MGDSDLPKLQINPASTVGLERWLVAIRNPEAMETQFQLMERRTITDSRSGDHLPGYVVLGHIMIRDKDWCAVGEWIAINLWSGDPSETGQAEPIIEVGAKRKVSEGGR